MDNRPFYELDDDEILIEEAAGAALSDAVTPVATTATVVPALPLRSALDKAQIRALVQRFALKKSLTLLDHAYLINQLACTLSMELQDVYGFDMAVRKETAMLLLDMGRITDSPRSNDISMPLQGIVSIRTADLDYTQRSLPGLSLRFTREDLAQFATEIESTSVFFSFRRLTLALAPMLTDTLLLTDMIERYATSVRILFSSAAAKQAVQPWKDIAMLTDTVTERDARNVIKMLHESTGELEI